MLDVASRSVNTVSELLLCALLAMALLAQADSVMNRYGAGEQSGGFSTPADSVIIAQVAAETAQLLPSNRPGVTPSSQVTRAAKPARVTTRSPKTNVVKGGHLTSGRSKVIKGHRFTPSAVPSKYKDDAEQFAKANGCPVPVATMKLAVVGPESFESFGVSCGTDVSMSIRCDSGRCRTM